MEVIILGFGFVFLLAFGLLNRKKIQKSISLLALFFSGVFLLISFFSFFYSHQNTLGESSDILFVLDVSQSMKVTDIGDKNDQLSRFDAAKIFIQNMILQFPNNTYGLMIYAGESHINIPFTTNPDTFLTLLDAIRPESLTSGGNNLKGAYQSSLQVFSQQEKIGAIIFLSDFEVPKKSFENVENELTGLPYYDISRVNIVNVGFGTSKGGNIVVGTDPFGLPIVRKDGKEIIVSVFDEKIAHYFNQGVKGKLFVVNETKKINSIVSKMLDFPVSQNTKNENGSFDVMRIYLGFSYICFLIFLIGTFFERRSRFKFLKG